MSDTMVLEATGAKSTFDQAASTEETSSISPFTDFDRRRYVELMAGMRGRVLDMVKAVRTHDEGQKKHQRQLAFDFFKAGLGTAMNVYGALRSPTKMISWAFNLFETALQIKNSLKNNELVKQDFERTKDGLLFTLRTAAYVDSMPKPTDAHGNKIFVEPVMLVPNPVTGSALDKAFVEKYIPKTLEGKFLREEDKGKPFDLHKAIWGPNGP